MKIFSKCKICNKKLSRKNAIHCIKHRPRRESNNPNWGGGLIEIKYNYCKKTKKIKRKELIKSKEEYGQFKRVKNNRRISYRVV